MFLIPISLPLYFGVEAGRIGGVEKRVLSAQNSQLGLFLGGGSFWATIDI